VSELQHPESRPFELVADVYERARPEYPVEAVDWTAERLGLGVGRTVLDLGAGTGKLTRALVRTGARVIAVEPGERMLAELRGAVPGVESLQGAAEAIPLEDDSVDAIAVGQAFHWFRHDEAVPELHRVLRRGGGVALIWNNRDPDDALQTEITKMIRELPARRARLEHSARRLTKSGLFGPIEERRFSFVHELDADGLVARIASISYVAAAPPDRQAQLERQLRELADAHGGRIAFPYVADVYISRAV
jgi:ubiquinone/menaquinone biosynthesis C-methylase UbiE